MFDGRPWLNAAIHFSGIMLSLLGILQAISFRKSLNRRTLFYFIAFFSCLALDLISITGTGFIGTGNRAGEGTRLLHSALWFGHYLFSPLMACVSTAYLISLLDPDRQKRWLWRVFLGMSSLYFGMLVMTCFTGLYYYVDGNNVYQRGSGYWVSIVFSVLPLLLNMVLLIVGRRKLARREQYAFWVYSALPTAACVVQLFTTGIHFIIPAIIIAALAMYMFILSDQMERYRRQERERDELHMAAMLSQIQPHFLFNALAAIYDIARDSAETRQAISEFSEYLRMNIDSLKRKAPVPFETERKHVETYLKVEQLSMEDHLRWRFDCETEAFLLPALTVQPLVESAVKHGVSKRREGGTIVISTREDAENWIVSVIDDGVGFDPAALQDDGKTHVGIENVRERLRMMCGGQLTVTSVPGVGTESVITLPRRKSA